MPTSHRKLFVSVAVAALFLLIVHLTFKPLTSGDLRALVDGTYHEDESLKKQTGPSYRNAMLLLLDRIGVCIDMTTGQ
jgi:hypothetical protein